MSKVPDQKYANEYGPLDNDITMEDLQTRNNQIVKKNRKGEGSDMITNKMIKNGRPATQISRPNYRCVRIADYLTIMVLHALLHTYVNRRTNKLYMAFVAFKIFFNCIYRNTVYYKMVQQV